MLPYRRESPALPRCLVQGGRVVHGPQFAFCPSPQGRCPQPSSSSSSPRAGLSSAAGQTLAQAVPGSAPQGGPHKDAAITRCSLSPALHRLPAAHACPFTVGAVPCPDHGFPCPGSPGRLGESRERYELDVLPWQGPRLGLEELQRPGETPWVVGTKNPG